MATITFTGPSIDNPAVQASKIVSVPDGIFGATIEAMCALNGYSPDMVDGDGAPIGAAQFTVLKTIEYWKTIALSYAGAKIDTAAAEASAAEKVAAVSAIDSGFNQITIATE